MKSMKKACLQAVVFVFALSFTVRADINYTVDRSVGSGSITGTITTDGTTGALATTDIVDWNLVLTTPTSSFTLLGPLSGANSVIEPPGGAFSATLGGDLTATSSDLLFNFGAGNGGRLLLQGSLYSGVDYYCADAGPVNAVCLTGESVVSDSSQFNTTLSGNTVIGTVQTTSVTPEPTFMALTGFGFAGVAFVAYRRRRVV